MVRESGFDFRQWHTYFSSLCCPHQFQGQSNLLYIYNGYWKLRTWIYNWVQCRFLEEEADIRKNKIDFTVMDATKRKIFLSLKLYI